MLHHGDKDDLQLYYVYVNNIVHLKFYVGGSAGSKGRTVRTAVMRRTLYVLYMSMKRWLTILTYYFTLYIIRICR